MGLSTDFRYALRGLWRRPLASATAVLTLALALAASAILLLALHALYLARLPYPNGERVASVYADMTKIGIPQAGMSWALAEQVGTLPAVADLAGYNGARVAVRIGEFPETMRATNAEPALFDVLGAGIVRHGRPFTRSDVDSGERVVVLGHETARELFGEAAAALDGELVIDGAPHKVIGVLTPGTGFPDADSRMILPLARPAQTQSLAGNVGSIQTVVSLAVGADETLLRTQLTQALDRLVEQSDEVRGMRDVTGIMLVAQSWRQQQAGPIGGTLGLLAAALAGLLLLAGSNVSSVLMERFAARRSEMSVRSALGASRTRLVRMVLADAFVLSLAGWLLGLLLTALAVSFQQSWRVLELPQGFVFGFAPLPVLASLLLTMLLSVLTAIFPALLAARTDARRAEMAQRGGSDARAAPARRLLVGVQAAVSVALLVVALLLGRSLFALWEVDPGFTREGVLTADIEPRGEAYATPEARFALANRLLDESRLLPGVTAVGLSDMLPFGNGYSMGSYEIEGLTDPENPPVAYTSSVSAQYFESMSIPLLRGRAFVEQEDREASVPVAIIDKRLADLHFEGRDPIGQRIRLGPGEWSTIVGVVGAVAQQNLAHGADRSQIYLPLSSVPPQVIQIALRTQIAPASILPGLRELLRGIDPGLPLRRTATMSERLDESLQGRSGPLGIVVFFAAVALLLAGLGLYGLLATAVIERRPEIGVRLALGAQKSTIVGSVVRDGLRLVIVGIVAGLVAVAVLVPLLRHHLYGVGAADPVSYLLATAMLVSIAVLATVFPALRAAKVDPALALRNE